MLKVFVRGEYKSFLYIYAGPEVDEATAQKYIDMVKKKHRTKVYDCKVFNEHGKTIKQYGYLLESTKTDKINLNKHKHDRQKPNSGIQTRLL